MANHDDSSQTSQDLCESLFVALRNLDPTINRDKKPTLCAFHPTSVGKKPRTFAYITHFKQRNEIKVDFLCDPKDSMLKMRLPDGVNLSAKKSTKSSWQKNMPYYFRLSKPDLIESVAKFLHDESYLLVIIEDYFSILLAELKGKGSMSSLNDSSNRMIYQNISAVLLYKFELPYIEGYQPLKNYPKSLEYVVEKYVSGNLTMIQDLLELADKPPVVPVKDGVKLDLQFIIVPAPPPQPQNGEPQVKTPGSFVYPGFDFGKREANNRSLGKAGEEFVFECEKIRLRQEGRIDLANKVEWTSKTKGDGTGYDILSFESNGAPRYIEVKTTTCGIRYPFYISRNELEFSKNHRGEFYIYRVFNFKKEARFFILHGALDKHCQLTAESFRAIII